MVAGAIMISFSAVFVKLAHVGPTVAGFYRMLFGGLILAVIVLARREKLWHTPRTALLCVICGLIFSADLFFWHRSVHLIGILSTKMVDQSGALTIFNTTISKPQRPIIDVI